MIGQEGIKRRIENYDKYTFPKSNLLVGSRGSGKHTIVNELSDRFGLPVKDISFEVSKGTIDEIYLSVNRAIYVVDINKLSSKHRYLNKENVLLKFIEEPPDTAIVFVLAEYDTQVIDTIRNRCSIWRLAPYSIEELSQFKTFDNEIIYTLTSTPGQVLESKNYSYYSELLSLCGEIVRNINRANVSNTLSLEKHIGEDKYELELFLKALKLVVSDEYRASGDERLLQCYELITDYIDRSHVLGVNKTHLFYGFILALKDILND